MRGLQASLIRSRYYSCFCFSLAKTEGSIPSLHRAGLSFFFKKMLIATECLQLPQSAEAEAANNNATVKMHQKKNVNSFLMGGQLATHST